MSALVTSNHLQQPTSSSNHETKRTGRPEMAVNAPMFLKKTYTMIDTCNHTIGGWDENGVSFVIKDSERFATEVIPEYFKHNNLSSFVRQLNFYGFRKIKNSCFRFTEADMMGTTTKILQFRHDMFRRDRPDLLPYIKKHAKSSSNESQEVAALKIQIQELRDQLDNKTCEMDELRSLVEEMAQVTFKGKAINVTSGVGSSQPSPAKKQKLLSREDTELVPEGTLSSTTTTLQQVPSAIVSASSVSLKSDEEEEDRSYEESFHESCLDQPKDTFDNVLSDNELSSTQLLTDLDGTSCFESFPDFCDPIGELEAIYREQPCVVTQLMDVKDYEDVTTTTSYCAASSTSILDPFLMSKIATALSTLPEELQHTFVDRFVDIVSDADSFTKQTESIVSLADLISKSHSLKSPVNSAFSKLSAAATDENTSILAAAALENYIKSSSLNPSKVEADLQTSQA